MATHTGSEGTVKLGTVGSDTAIGEIRSYSISETGDTIEDTAMGDSSRTYAVGLKTFSGTVDCYFDPDDAKQDEMVAGASLTLTVYPDTIIAITVCSGERSQARVLVVLPPTAVDRARQVFLVVVA